MINIDDLVALRRKNAGTTLIQNCPEARGKIEDLPHPSISGVNILRYVDENGKIHATAYKVD